MSKKILGIFILVLTFSFNTEVFASLTFTTDAITGTTASTIDLGAGNDLLLQTSGGKVSIGMTSPSAAQLKVVGVDTGGIISSITGTTDNQKAIYVENYNTGATQEYGVYSFVNPATATLYTAGGLFAAQPTTAAASSQHYGIVSTGRARFGPAGSYGIGGYFKGGLSVFGNPSIILTKSVGLIADAVNDQNGINNIFEGRYSGVVKMVLDGNGNLGIGTAIPNANAILDVSSTTKAFMPPRMTTTERDAIPSPTAGMLIYNLTTNKLNVYTTAWETVTSL